MAELEDTTEIPVLAIDLRSILRAVDAAHTEAAARDIQAAAHQMNARPRYSTLTRSLDRSRKRIEGYLASAEQDDSSEDDGLDSIS